MAPNFDYSTNAPAGDCPANALSWYEAAEYCNWLSEQEGLKPCYQRNAQGQYAEGMRPAADHLLCDGYRLPTEAEWEFACRAGAITRRYYGASDALLSQYACYAGNLASQTFPVGLLKPNDFGLFDMLGNVLEWCDDPWTGPYALRRLDQSGDDVGDDSTLSDKIPRVPRGGAFDSAPPDVRCAKRNVCSPNHQNGVIGFRLARTLPHGYKGAVTAPREDVKTLAESWYVRAQKSLDESEIPPWIGLMLSEQRSLQSLPLSSF